MLRAEVVPLGVAVSGSRVQELGVPSRGPGAPRGEGQDPDVGGGSAEEGPGCGGTAPS